VVEQTPCKRQVVGSNPTAGSMKIIIKKPLITQKTTKLAKEGVYVFYVDPKANKNEIKNEIEKLFKVNVVDVRTVNLKRRERGLSKYKNIRQKVKKAYVKLKEGQTINIFPQL
jgi:large subunit ribosomal protein L23